MGNNICIDVGEFPSSVLEKHAHVPKIGDEVEFDPCFQCTNISSVRKAGSPGRAVITKIKYCARVPQSEQDNKDYKIPDKDYVCKVYGRVLTPTSITPYCNHAHGILVVPVGLETILRYKTEISPDTDAEGWVIKNEAVSSFF
jgi:hypothetical protein